jgi:hypothetical protein
MISHSRFLYSASLFAILLLCWLPTIAQTSSAQEAKPGTISGMVVNQSGRPLPNARISLRRWGLMEPESIHTTTDREGKFEVSGLQTVNYQIFAYLEGYVSLLRDLDDTQPAVYRAGDSVTLVLTKSGVITGAVTNQAGEPIVGVNVRALMVPAANRFPNAYSRTGQADLTDDRGIYRIYGLPEGTYVVWAGGGGEENYSSNVDPFADDIPTYAPASTRDTAQEIIVRAGAETNGVDIQYRGGSGHAVSGSARGPEGTQLHEFGIFMTSVSGPGWQTRSSQGANDRGFVFQGVDDGDYSVTAVSQSLDGELMFSDPKQIKVRGVDVTGVELIVQPTSSVSGRVVLEETKTAECSDKQRPIFTETLVSALINQPTRWLLSPTANADERGNVLLKNLLPGRYFFTTQYFAKDWYLKSLSFAPSETANTKAGKPLDAARTWTTLKPGDRLNGLTIILAQGAASLRGQIALSDGESLAEKMNVYLVPAEKEAADNPLRFYVESVTAEGKVSLNNLAPGRYLVFAQEATEPMSPSTKLRSPDETAYRLKLRRTAETVKTEIELKPCQKLTDLKVPTKGT